GDELVPAQHAVDELSDLAVVLETAGVRPGLVIEHEDIRSPGDGAKIAKAFALAADGPAVHAGPDTLGAARGASDLVIEGPQLEAAVIVPADPGFVGAAIPIRLQGKIEIRFVFKIFAAVVAVADRLAAQPAPAVVGEPFRMIERRDLLQDRGQMLGVIRTVDAGDVKIGGPIGLTIGIDGEPAGMRLI